MSSPEPDPTRNALQRANELCGLGRFTEAATMLRQIVSSDPQNALAWSLLAQAQLGTGEHADALQSARAASSLAPDEEWPHRLTSIALRALGHYSEAALAAREAVRLAPQAWAGYVQLAYALIRIPGRVDEAQVAASRAVELAPSEASTHLAAGAAAAADHRREDAADAFRRALAIDPQNAVAHNELARLNLRKGRRNANASRLAAAAVGFATAIRANPKSEVSRRNLDLVLLLFLRWTAYFIFIDAYLAGGLGAHSTSLASRIIPIALLAIPVGFALQFTLRLPANLRPYLFRQLSTGGTRPAAAFEAVAVIILIASCLSSASSRTLMAGLAFLAAALGRFALWSQRKKIARTG